MSPILYLAQYFYPSAMFKDTLKHIKTTGTCVRLSTDKILVLIIMVSSYIAHIQCSVRFTHITPGHWTCLFMYHFNSLFKEYSTAAILALGTNRTHCHLCLTRYSFKPQSSEACEDKVSFPRPQHRKNGPILSSEGET